MAERSAGSGQPIDLVAEFVSRYPLMVICDLLGVPLTDLDRAAHASHLMTHGDADDARAGLAELESLVATAIRTSNEHNTGATLTDLVIERARAELGEITDDELLYMITGLIFAGQVTTESFLGFLLAHQLVGALDSTAGSGDKDDADAVEAFVSEALRLHPPAPFTLWRFTTTDVDLAGASLPTGAPVLIDIEGINTDPRTRTAPHNLDPARPRLPDLIFGDGPHACIGAQLAHLEARTVVEVLRRDFPDAHLAIPFDMLERDSSGIQTRRLASLPIWLKARHSS